MCPVSLIAIYLAKKILLDKWRLFFFVIDSKYSRMILLRQTLSLYRLKKAVSYIKHVYVAMQDSSLRLSGVIELWIYSNFSSIAGIRTIILRLILFSEHCPVKTLKSTRSFSIFSRSCSYGMESVHLKMTWRFFYFFGAIFGIQLL